MKIHVKNLPHCGKEMNVEVPADKVQAEVDAQLRLLVAMRDAGVREVALRAQGLSAKSLAVVADMIERTRELEGLDSPARTRRTLAARDKSPDKDSPDKDSSDKDSSDMDSPDQDGDAELSPGDTR